MAAKIATVTIFLCLLAFAAVIVFMRVFPMGCGLIGAAQNSCHTHGIASPMPLNSTQQRPRVLYYTTSDIAILQQSILINSINSFCAIFYIIYIIIIILIYNNVGGKVLEVLGVFCRAVRG